MTVKQLRDALAALPPESDGFPVVLPVTMVCGNWIYADSRHFEKGWAFAFPSGDGRLFSNPTFRVDKAEGGTPVLVIGR